MHNRRAPIGRTAEIEQLAADRRAASAGRGRIVLVGGEAGIGKSTLLRHFEDTLALGRSIAASARCVEFGQVPMAPWRDALQQLAQRGSPAGAPIGELLDSSGWMQETLFNALDDMLAAYALRGTVALLVEDLHWADRATLGFLNYIADRIVRRRILVVATYRIEDLGSQHPQLAIFSALLAKRAVTTITLAPLSETALRALIERSPGAKTLSATTATEIARRSQGNPFFAEELVAHRQSTLPLSIRAAVLSRAAQLTDEQRALLSLAAVLGERFAIDRLVALAGGDRERVLVTLERGRALQLLSDEATNPGEIAFRHGLTQEVLYGELLAERVRPLHEAIAREFEERGGGAAGELAHHWRRAGKPELAATYDERAGDEACAIGAFSDAIPCYERALSERSEDPGISHKLGVALGAINELDAGVERLCRAAELYERAGDYAAYSENAFALVALRYNQGDVAAATATCEATIATLSSKLPQDAVNLFRTRLAFQCIAALDDVSASDFLDAVPEPIASPRLAMHVYSNRFKIAAMRGDLKAWRDFSARALAAAAQLEDGGSWTRMTSCHVALDAIGLGEMETARERLRDAAPPRNELQTPQATLLRSTMALECVLRGEFARCAELLRETDVLAQNYPVLVHARAADFALGICSGDEARLRRDDTAQFLRYGIERGMKVAIGLLGGPFAWALGLRGEADAAAAWIAQIAPALPTPHRFAFAYLAAAQFGREDDAMAMRSKLQARVALPNDRINTALLGLFDAFAARRGMGKYATEESLRAARLFEEIGWPWFAAHGYELGGEPRRALDIFRGLGSVADVRRLEVERSEPSSSGLSSREREVAQLVAKGHSNHEISQILHISTRTAEKHVFTALKKLNLRSRVQLGQLIARSEQQGGDLARFQDARAAE